MSATESVKTSREQNRSHRHSSLSHGNVIAFVFRSLDLDLFSSSPSPRVVISTKSSSNSSTKEEYQNVNELYVKPAKLLHEFIEVNKSSLNRRLVESLEELRLVGWFAPHTLLLSGPNEDIDVLKHGWIQRILQSPKGFLLKNVGTMTECSVEWIQSSQFISLTTALNDTVVELDRNGRCASRDAIVKYLKNVYHNVRIPSEDIIHRCLGKLIEQRKIYHDGVGYRALIDDSPIHKTEQKRKPCEESEEVSAKLSVKSSIKTRSENGSACPSSKVSKELEIKPNRKKHLSLDGSSKDETTTNCAYSDEDRNRLNLTFLENFINYGTPTMKSKTTKEKKKKTTLLSTQRKSTRYEKVDDEIKIIDISVFDSNLGMRNKKEAVTKSTGIESGDLFHNPGRPYDKHNREGKPIKRPKPHRSRSFTEPSKQRIRNRQSKEVGNDIDFPLRRVMGTEELRNLNRGDLGNAKNRIENEILDKDKKEEVDKARKDKRGSENCIKDTKWRDMSAKLIPKETNLFEKVGCAKYDLEKNGDLTSLSKMTRKSLKVSTDSDTVSGTCQSDALSSFQNGKKKDSSETISDNDNFDENALKCLCLTGILGNETINVAEERMNEMGKRKIKENFEDDSILYYNDSKSEECDCSFEDNHTGVKNIDFDSLDFGYAV